MDIRRIATSLVGIIFIVLGIYLPKLDYVKNYKLPNIEVYSEENISFMEKLIKVEGIDVILDNSHSMQYFNLTVFILSINRIKM